VGTPKLVIVSMSWIFGVSFIIDIPWKQIRLAIPFFEVIINWDGEGFEFDNSIAKG
jgi:hypothetical protein